MTIVHQPDSGVAVLLELAQEFEDGFIYEYERAMDAFPHGDVAFMSKAAHRAEVFEQLARMCRERAEARGKASK